MQVKDYDKYLLIFQEPIGFLDFFCDLGLSSNSHFSSLTGKSTELVSVCNGKEHAIIWNNVLNYFPAVLK